MVIRHVVCCEGYCDHRDLHVLTHACPTRRSSDLRTSNVGDRKEGNENRDADIATGAGAGNEAAKDQDRAITLRAMIAARRETPRPTTVSVREAMSKAAKAIGITRGSDRDAER